MTGNEESQEKHPYLYWEFYEAGGKQAVRKGNWKGVRLDVSQGNSYIELYDLSLDPSEELNIADHHPEIVRDMLKIMQESHTEIQAISLY